MNGIDAATLIVAIVLAGLGLAVGFGRTLKFFTRGIFGFIISVFVCATFGGMIQGIPAVQNRLTSLNQSMGGFLQTIHLETIVFYVVFFLVVPVVRIFAVKLIAGLFSADILPVRIVNRLLGMVLMVAAVFLLLLLVFAVFRVLQDTSFVQNILDSLNGTFLGKIYENNPVKFVQ